jgi:integrase/recombinase XerD
MAKRKAPKGCFWRGNTLYGRIQAKGGDIKWSLRTDDPKVARSPREAERNRAIATAHYGDQRRTFDEAYDAWSTAIVSDQPQDNHALR